MKRYTILIDSSMIVQIVGFHGTLDSMPASQSRRPMTLVLDLVWRGRQSPLDATPWCCVRTSLDRRKYVRAGHAAARPEEPAKSTQSAPF